MKNRLGFNILKGNTMLVGVNCIEDEGSYVVYSDIYEDFKHKYCTAAMTLEHVLEGLNELFICGVVELDMAAVKESMSIIKNTLGLNIKYIIDTFNEFKEDNNDNKSIYDSPMPTPIFYTEEYDRLSSIFKNKGMVVGKLPKFEEEQSVRKVQLSSMYGTSGNKDNDEEKVEGKRTNLTFNDVVGMDEVKEKLNDVIDQFKNIEKYKAWNIKPIRGILLYGPSGTGKSFISEAFANEIDAKFFPLSSADIMSKYLGESGKAIRKKFEEARKHPLSIIYIDEVDSIAAKRDGHENNKERNATLNELLVQMASPMNENIVMVFATNMLDLLDPAFLRSGRCDFKIEVPLPDFECRKGILELNSKNRPLADDVDFDKIARNMSGMNCADMSQVANEAARMALKANKDCIEQSDFEKAFEEMVCGAKSKTKRINDKEKDIVAIHETGHLFANEIYKVNKTKKISILPRGTTLGFVLHANEDEDDKFLNTREELLNRIRVSLAGRAAEEVFFGDITTGAHNDLEKANKIATSMVCDYAFVDELGLSIFDLKNINNLSSMNRIQAHIDKILLDCYNEVVTMIQFNKDKIRQFANILKEKEEMNIDEINEALSIGETC